MKGIKVNEINVSETPIYDRVSQHNKTVIERRALIVRVKEAKARGLSNVQIAHQEQISESTVRRLLEV